MATECRHNRKIAGRWEAVTSYNGDSNTFGPTGRWIEGYTESTTEQLDHERYMCMQCGHIMYYRATRASATKGKTITLDIKGLL